MPGRMEIQSEFISRIEKHQGILHKICFMYARNKADQEDLYQEMILQLWRSYPSFQNKSAFSTWMYRVGLNTAISYTNEKKHFTEPGNEKFPVFDLDKTMNYSEDIRLLYRAISSLNKIEKAIILMWLDEKPYQEIADMIGITVKNVSVKLVRIKEKLGKLMKRLQ